MSQGVDFALDPRLVADTGLVCDLPLCRVLLMDEARWPWLILVPRRPGLREVFDLPRHERVQLGDELEQAAQTLKSLFVPDKLNVAALGNQVEQLHVHVLGRYRDDPAWPSPVWGHSPRQPYAESDRQSRIERLMKELSGA